MKVALKMAHDTTSTGETLKPFVDTGASIETFV